MFDASNIVVSFQLPFLILNLIFLFFIYISNFSSPFSSLQIRRHLLHRLLYLHAPSFLQVKLDED